MAPDTMEIMTGVNLEWLKIWGCSLNSELAFSGHMKYRRLPIPPEMDDISCFSPRKSIGKWISAHLNGEHTPATEVRSASIAGLQATTLFDTSHQAWPPIGLPFVHVIHEPPLRVIALVTGLVFPWANPVMEKAPWHWDGLGGSLSASSSRGFNLELCVRAFFADGAERDYLEAGRSGAAHLFEIFTVPEFRGKGYANQALCSLWPHLESFHSVGIVTIYLDMYPVKRFAKFLRDKHDFHSRYRPFDRRMLCYLPTHGGELAQYQRRSIMDEIILRGSPHLRPEWAR